MEIFSQQAWNSTHALARPVLMVNYQAWGHTGPPPTNFAGPLPGTQTTFITPFCSMKSLLAGGGGWWGVSSALLLTPGCLLQWAVWLVSQTLISPTPVLLTATACDPECCCGAQHWWSTFLLGNVLLESSRLVLFLIYPEFVWEKSSKAW